MRPQETHNSFQMLMYCHHSPVLREFFHQPEMKRNEIKWEKQISAKRGTDSSFVVEANIKAL